MSLGNKIFFTAASVLVAGLVAGTGYGLYRVVQENFNNDGVVIAEGDPSATLSGLLPGESVLCDYSLTMPASKVELGLSFEFGEERELLPYLDVSVLFDEQAVFDGKLEEASKTDIHGEVGSTADIKIVYCLPLEADNSAQGKKLDVTVRFSMQEVEE